MNQTSTKGRPLWVTVLLLLAATIYVVFFRPSGSTQQPGANHPPIPDRTSTHETRASTSDASQPTSTQTPPRQADSKTSSPPADRRASTPSKPVPGRSAGESSDGGIHKLFEEKKSDTWVQAEGRVVKLLPDDADGDKHQRWLLELSSDITILMAHNIDVAPRVPLREGDQVRFRGEYEWSEKGGTVHFTHKPKFNRREPGGWVEHNGVRYE